MNCILCGIETKGSTGAAGIFWPCLCQPCKDREDRALADRLILDVPQAFKKALREIIDK